MAAVAEWTDTIHAGEPCDLLASMPADAVHAVVCTPPSGRLFRGAGGDCDPVVYQEWAETWATLALRALKPGGHLIAIGGPHTHHRLFTGVEDAGFEIRDTITWHYRPAAASVDAPESSAYIVVARSPFDGPTVECVLEHGTGGLNIDACRIPTDEEWDGREIPDAEPGVSLDGSTTGELNRQTSGSHSGGRFPANVLFDEAIAEVLDDEVGELEAGAYPSKRSTSHFGNTSGQDDLGDRTATDSGGPSRYFHTTDALSDVLTWLLTLVSRENQIVLDPFGGAGPTRRVAADLGRRYIGFEPGGGV